ncbi:hypothetical protein [Kineosporia succinea]|uniref:Uncharacterized protein n=1 Tax=Kineosporia succinea TaxID=84632 RepID=A0ABT9PCH1_9ACTN|nr:hypothetical protein [Kineosporia succinea]MDP9830413.1 hypothetical protein [Kineosporia succinea]
MDVVVVVVVMLALVGGHLLLLARGPVWAGAVVPVVWVIACAVWIVGGGTPGPRQFYVAAFGLFFFVGAWLTRHQGRW